mmetsp:Transcript_37234/g.99095  ORF Transcript_37234/g.99095 Transcript_37234/m.99095 type:complete len:310 (-) Transcript_37234:1421-2350(-)
MHHIYLKSDKIRIGDLLADGSLDRPRQRTVTLRVGELSEVPDDARLVEEVGHDRQPQVADLVVQHELLEFAHLDERAPLARHLDDPLPHPDPVPRQHLLVPRCCHRKGRDVLAQALDAIAHQAVHPRALPFPVHAEDGHALLVRGLERAQCLLHDALHAAAQSVQVLSADRVDVRRNQQHHRPRHAQLQTLHPVHNPVTQLAVVLQQALVRPPHKQVHRPLLQEQLVRLAVDGLARQVQHLELHLAPRRHPRRDVDAHGAAVLVQPLRGVVGRLERLDHAGLAGLAVAQQEKRHLQRALAVRSAVAHEL